VQLLARSQSHSDSVDLGKAAAFNPEVCILTSAQPCCGELHFAAIGVWTNVRLLVQVAVHCSNAGQDVLLRQVATFEDLRP
jgi:hypothetical protein